jgi:peptidoglycan/xylan/chitin deacetylase (PgdA/CDA1 family)
VRNMRERTAILVAKIGAGLVACLCLTVAAVAPASATMSARIVFSGGRSQPVVALTFDDGNDATQLRLIFTTLRATHVPATFFPFARAMTLDPALWRSLAAAGYPIGNHTVTHPDLLRLSDAALRGEIVGATAVIRAISGRAPIPVFRPPYGAWDARVAAAASAAGYPTMLLWDVDPRDWSGIAGPVIAQRVLTHARDGSVILLHVGPYHTAAALPTIIAGLARRGFRFVTVSQLLAGDLRGAVTLSATQIATLTAVSSPRRSMPPRSAPGERLRSPSPNLAPLERADSRGLAIALDRPSLRLGVRRNGIGDTSPTPAGATVALAVLSGAAILSALVIAAARYRKPGIRPW